MNLREILEREKARQKNNWCTEIDDKLIGKELRRSDESIMHSQ